MPLVTTQSILDQAVSEGTGVGAFNVIHIETAEAIVAAAELAQRPVIMQISENCVNYHGALGAIGQAMLTIARGSTASVAVHLDHAETESLAKAAIDLGFSSVMYDGSKLPFRENVARTRSVVAYARNAGACVEAELGEVGGKGGAHVFGVRTDPEEARRFVSDTGVAALAVAVGSSHAMTERTALLDLDLITRLAAAVTVPLVLHGSSGVPDATIAAGIQAGLVKINVSTHLNAVFTSAIRAYLDDNSQVVDSRKYIAAGRRAVASEAARLLVAFSSR